MATGPIGNCWATGSWVDTAWVPNLWGAGTVIVASKGAVTPTDALVSLVGVRDTAVSTVTVSDSLVDMGGVTDA